MNDNIDEMPAWRREIIDLLAEFEQHHAEAAVSVMVSDGSGMYASIRNKEVFIDQLYTLAKENPDAGAAMLHMLTEWLEEVKESMLPAAILKIEPNTIKS